MAFVKVLQTISDRTDGLMLRIGRGLSWTNGLLVLVIALQVTLRYGFGRGLVILEELQWHLYGLAFMFGLSYAVVTNAHVRVDLLHSRFSIRTRMWIELLGGVFLLLPFTVAVVLHGYDFFYDAWIHNERSSAPLGLPWRWAIKAVIPISFGLFGMAVLSRMIRSLIKLIGSQNGDI